MHQGVDFVFWPGDKVQNLLGETGVVEVSAGVGRGIQQFLIAFAGEKESHWYFENELTQVED